MNQLAKSQDEGVAGHLVSWTHDLLQVDAYTSDLDKTKNPWKHSRKT